MIYHAGFEIDPWMSRFFPIEIGTFVLGMLGRRFYDAYVVHMDRKSCMAFGVSFVLLTLFIYDIAILSYRFHALALLRARGVGHTVSLSRDAAQQV